MAHTPAMIHPGLVNPLKIAFWNPILYKRPPRNGPRLRPIPCVTTRTEARVVRLRMPTMRASEQYFLLYMKDGKARPVTVRPMRIK